ncbi:MAG: AsmA family protein, partial [Bacteroidales bacterium]|nr:AsmA family protein [Bacteroidales bacterium]
MKKVQSVTKKILKVILWVALIFVLIFLIVAALIQIPAIQTKVTNYAISFISSKTHTRVEIEKISISFPKSVVLKGLYLEDTQKDTILYVGMAKVNIVLFDLFSNKIAINSFVLEDATIKLYSTKTDPLFNYNFLFTAFADTTKQVKADTISASKWTFSLDKVNLKNVRFTYNDEYAGMNVFAGIEKAELSVDEISPGESLYQFDELFMEGLKVIVLANEPANSQEKNSDSVLPKISAQKLQLINSTVSYADSAGYLSVISAIDRLELEDAFIDVQKELLTFDYLNLKKSNIRYHNFEPEFFPDAMVADS